MGCLLTDGEEYEAIARGIETRKAMRELLAARLNNLSLVKRDMREVELPVRRVGESVVYEGREARPSTNTLMKRLLSD